MGEVTCQKSKWFVIKNPWRIEESLGDARMTRLVLAFNVELNQYIAGARKRRGFLALKPINLNAHTGAGHELFTN